MYTKDFLRLGVPLGQATRFATDFVSKFILGGGDKPRLHEEVAAIVANPSAFVDDPVRKDFAKALLIAPPPPRAVPVKYRQWGEGLEHNAAPRPALTSLLDKLDARHRQKPENFLTLNEKSLRSKCRFTFHFNLTRTAN